MNRQTAVAAETAYLAARCRLVLDAIEAAEPDFGDSAAQIRGVIDDTAARGNVRGMRTIRRDLLEMSRALPPAARQQLQLALDAQTSDDPADRDAG